MDLRYAFIYFFILGEGGVSAFTALLRCDTPASTNNSGIHSGYK